MAAGENIESRFPSSLRLDEGFRRRRALLMNYPLEGVEALLLFKDSQCGHFKTGRIVELTRTISITLDNVPGS